MKKIALSLVALSVLSACGGGGSRFYFGGSTVTPTGSGAIAGLASSDVSVIEEAGLGGVAYGFGRSEQALRQSAGASGGDSGAFAVSGVIPGADVGSLPTTGRAVMRGRYEMLNVTGVESSSNVANWQQSTDSGNVTLIVNFAENLNTGYLPRFNGQSGNGLLEFSNVEFGSTGRIRGGEVTYRGSDASIDGTIGGDGIVAAINGEGRNRIFAGGIVAATE